MRSASGVLALISVVGIMLTQVAATWDIPISLVPNQLTGRVYPAVYWFKFSSHWFFYTTPIYCSIAWTFTGLLAASCLVLLYFKSLGRE